MIRVFKPSVGTEPGRNPGANAPATLRRRLRVALGQEPGDLLITGGQVVNVFTQRVEAADVVIADGWIAGVGPYRWKAARTISAEGQTVMPGLIDSHMHLESTLLSPAELARLIVPMGTSAIFSDSHEVGNVLGLDGIRMLAAASEGIALDLFFTASSCVPATRREDAGAELGPAEIRALLAEPRVVGLAEVMDVPALLAGEPEMLEKVAAALSAGTVLDGHAPGMTGQDLVAYVAAGIRSDHESTTVEEARVKAALGMLVQVREGSSARNLEALLPLLVSGELGDSWCLVTDDIFPTDLKRQGHLDALLRRLVAAGVPTASAVRHASYVPARHYGLHDRGAVAPGYRANLALVDDLRQFSVRLAIHDGSIVGSGDPAPESGPSSRLDRRNTIQLPPLDESAFDLPLSGKPCPLIEIVPGQIVTKKSVRDVRSAGGRWVFDPDEDVALIASIERHRASGRIGLGLVSGFGLKRQGALGSSVAHDSHNLIVAGTNPRDLLVCARTLAEHGGGFVAASEGSVRALLPLPVAGLLSLESAEVVCRQLDDVNSAARALGCSLDAPFGTLSFLALPVIPEIRITTRGVFDVVERTFPSL